MRGEPPSVDETGPGETALLSEPQIRRFSRQVILDDVRVSGQQKLLDTAVRADFAVTRAVLAAGGSPVAGVADEPGFPQPAASCVAPVGSIARHPRAARFQVAVGKTALVYRQDGGCAACFALTEAALDDGAPDEALQSLAALVFQRMVLGLSEPLGTAALERVVPLVGCEAHR